MAAQLPPQLALDIGNTTTKAAVWQHGHLGDVHAWPTSDDWPAADALVTNLGVQNIIYSTVANVPPAKWLDKWTSTGRRVISLEANRPLPFPSRYASRATLGQDRIAAVAGSLAQRPDPPVPTLVIDAGTCVTLDLLDAAGVYHGGNISPGLRMRLRAMHAFTARLPLVEPATPSGAVGTSTVRALRHGGQRGLVYEIEGLFRRLAVDHPGLLIHLTGGDAAYLAGELSVPFVLYPNLVLRGLHHILSDYVLNES